MLWWTYFLIMMEYTDPENDLSDHFSDDFPDWFDNCPVWLCVIIGILIIVIPIIFGIFMSWLLTKW